MLFLLSIERVWLSLWGSTNSRAALMTLPKRARKNSDLKPDRNYVSSGECFTLVLRVYGQLVKLMISAYIKGCCWSKAVIVENQSFSHSASTASAVIQVHRG
jgi:hypothetical protein